MAERVRRRSGCRWLPSDASVLEVVAQLAQAAPDGRATIQPESGLPGVLTLTGSHLSWEISPLLRRIIETVVRATGAPMPGDLLDRLTWRLPIGAVRAVELGGGLFTQSLTLRCADRTEIFRVAGGRAWRRAIQDAAGIVPDEGLSLAADPPPPADEASLSRAAPEDEA